MAFSLIEANLSFGGLEWTLDGLLHKLVHIRGWNNVTSYIIADVYNPHSESINEFMNYGTITVKYGKDGEYTGNLEFEILSVQNLMGFSNLKVRIYAVEKGFNRLVEKTRIQGFPNATVAEAFARMCQEAGIKTQGIKQTSGKFSYVQPNISDMEFMVNHLLPIATDSAKTAPYLFTIDNNVCHLRPPNLTKEPNFEFIVDPSNETVVKKFNVHNIGMVSDHLFGSNYCTYGYDFKRKGTLVCETDRETANPIRMNQKPYKSGHNRIEIFPYEEMWMTDAHNRNNMARGSFIIAATALITGEVEFFFDQIYQFNMEAFQKQKTEYSGRYYVYEVKNTLMRRLFTSELSLFSNAFLKGETTKSPRRKRTDAGGIPNRKGGGLQQLTQQDLNQIAAQNAAALAQQNQ